jgi:hypothetical protein
LKTKPKLQSFARDAWAWLSEVPDRPHAPRALRVRRALPIALPSLAILALLGWKLAVSDPHARAQRAAGAPLLALEEETTSLRLACSDKEARDLAVQAAESARSFLKSPSELGPALGGLEKLANREGWEGGFQPMDTVIQPPGEGALTGVLAAKGTLKPAPENQRPWPTLLLLLDDLSTWDKQIALTRLVIRADEQGRYSVEAGLRLAYLLNHEKAAQ